MDDRANSQDDRDATLPDLDPKINMSNEVTRKLLNAEHQDIIVVIDDTNIYREFKKTKWEKARKSEKIDMLQKYVKGLSIRKQPLFDKLQSYSASLRRDYKHLPALLLRVKSITDVNNIAQLPFVKAIYENSINELYLSQSLPLILQPNAASLGMIGKGTTIAIIDTGLDYTRSAFGSCSAPGVPNDCKVVFAQDFTASDDGQMDAHGHGTNVSGIALGVAPGAKIAALDVFSGSWAYASDIIAAIDWIIENQANYNIVSANLSLGSSSHNPSECINSWATIPFERLRSVGVIPVVASGNDANKSGLADPACAPGAVRVGAVYDDNFGALGWMTCSDAIAERSSVTCFSNSADFLTLLAPGAIITSAGLTMSGTSMAAPHVAGAIAVLRGDAAFPDDTLSETIEHLTNTGTPITDSANGLVHPLINLEAAILDGLPKEPPEILSFSPQTAAEKMIVTILGNNFFKVSAVKFGGVNADSYDVISSSEIRAVVGSGASGALKVVAQSGIGSKMGFVYNPAKLVTISNTPESALITSPAQILSISVQGNYSDGSTSIVTASSEFYSTDTKVVSVDANGVVTVKGEGVADIVSTIGNLTAITHLSVDISSIVDRELEPNNSIANANPVDISNNVYRGNLSDSSDVDYYKVTISLPSVLSVLIRPSNDSYTGGVVRASITDVSGTIYAAKQISSDMSSYVNLSAALIDPGNYYLRIDKLNYYSVFTKGYEFLVQSNDDPILFGKREKEPNDSMIQATVFPIDGSSVYGQLSSTTDIDMYAYDLAKGVFLLQVKPENNVYDGGVIVVSIKDSSGVVLSSKEVTSTQSTFIALTARIDTAGRYYVVVNRKASYSIFNKDYELLVNLDPDDIIAPTATTNAASSISTTGATLNGTINANNSSTTVTFQYGTTTSYGNTVTATPGTVTGNANTLVSKAITGLSPNTTYHYCVIAVNSAGTTKGSDMTFTTRAKVPAAGPFSNITNTRIRANWMANGNPAGTQYFCENQTLGTNSGWITATSWDSGGLTCGTSCSFRVQAKNSDGVKTAWVALGNQAAYCDIWTTTKRLTNNAGHSFYPAISVNGSNIYVVWEDNTPGNNEILFKKSIDGGTTWTTNKSLSNNATASFAPAIAVNSSNIYVVWTDDYTPENQEIYFKKSGDGGITWTTNKRLTYTAGYSYAPAIAVDGSNIYVVWADDTPGNCEIYFKKSVDGGTTWVTKRITNNAGWSGDPVIAVDGPNIYMAWEDDTSGNYEIYFKKSDDRGITWTTNRRLTYTTGYSYAPAIAVNGSNIYVVWEDSTPGNNEILFKKSTDEGTTWTTNTNLSNTAGGSYDPSVVVDGPYTYVVWDDNTPGNYEIYFKKSDDDGTTWTTSKRLTNNAGNSFRPAIAVDGSNAYVVWEDNTLVNYEIYFKKGVLF